MSNINLYNYVDSIKDFPKKGILFRDISPLLQDYNAFSELRVSCIPDNFLETFLFSVNAVSLKSLFCFVDLMSC